MDVTIPAEILRRFDLSISTKLVYGLLLKLKWEKTSRQEIATLLGMGVRTVSMCLKSLQMKGLL